MNILIIGGGIVLLIIAVVIVIVIISKKKGNSLSPSHSQNNDDNTDYIPSPSSVELSPSPENPLDSLDYPNKLSIDSHCPNLNVCRGYCKGDKCSLLEDSGEVSLFNGECQNYVMDGKCGISSIYKEKGINCTSCRGPNFISPNLLIDGDVDKGGQCTGDLEPVHQGGMMYPFIKNQLKNDGAFDFTNSSNIFIKNDLCKKGYLCKNFNPQSHLGSCLVKGTVPLGEQCKLSSNDISQIGANTDDPSARCSGNMICENSKCSLPKTIATGNKCSPSDKTNVCNKYSFCGDDNTCLNYINAQGISESNTSRNKQVDMIYKNQPNTICNKLAQNTTFAYESKPWETDTSAYSYKKGQSYEQVGTGDYNGCYYEIDPIQVNTDTSINATNNELYSYENKIPFKENQNFYFAKNTNAVENDNIKNMLPPPPIWTDSGKKTAAPIASNPYQNVNVLNCLSISNKLQKPLFINNYNNLPYGCNVSNKNIKYNVNENSILNKNSDYRLIMPNNGLYFTYGDPSYKTDKHSPSPSSDPSPSPKIELSNPDVD